MKPAALVAFAMAADARKAAGTLAALSRSSARFNPAR
jgi:hypothetical protein